MSSRSTTTLEPSRDDAGLRSGPQPRLAGRVVCSAVRVYQLARVGRAPKCRYVPSCSAYTLEAVQQHGTIKGTWLAVRRLLRCHPWGSMGWDPVPVRETGDV